MTFRTQDSQQDGERLDMQKEEIPLASLPTSKLQPYPSKCTGTIYVPAMRLILLKSHGGEPSHLILVTAL